MHLFQNLNKIELSFLEKPYKALVFNIFTGPDLVVLNQRCNIAIRLSLWVPRYREVHVEVEHFTENRWIAYYYDIITADLASFLVRDEIHTDFWVLLFAYEKKLVDIL